MDTHIHTLTVFPSLGQETAQCSEAPFSIFVVMSAWLLREEGREGGRTKGQLGEQEGAQGSTRQGEQFAESGCRATVQGLGESKGPLGGEADAVQAPEQPLSHSCWSREGQPGSASPQGRFLGKGPGFTHCRGGKGQMGPSLPSFLSKSVPPVGTCVLPRGKPWVPAQLHATCRSHPLGTPIHSFPIGVEERGSAVPAASTAQGVPLTEEKPPSAPARKCPFLGEVR